MDLKVLSYLFERIYIGNIIAIRFLTSILPLFLPFILALFLYYFINRYCSKKHKRIEENKNKENGYKE